MFHFEFAERPNVADMRWPVQCVSCGSVYDGGPVEVVARYADCTRWKQPCCSVIGDDRPVGWGGTVHQLNKDGSRK